MKSRVPSAADPRVIEALLILRELAAGRDAQILGHVRAQMAVGGAR